MKCQTCKYWIKTSKTTGICTIEFGSDVEIVFYEEAIEAVEDINYVIDFIFTPEDFFCATYSEGSYHKEPK